MMTVAVGGCAAPARINHQGTEHPNHPHHVAENLALVPSHRGFGAPLREPEVECACEELFPAVQPARLQQFLRTNHAKRIEELCADDVLAALASVERQID